MTTAIEAQTPGRFAEQAQELVRDGWAADFNAVLVDVVSSPLFADVELQTSRERQQV